LLPKEVTVTLISLLPKDVTVTLMSLLPEDVTITLISFATTDGYYNNDIFTAREVVLHGQKLDTAHLLV
jgi:hypothetical protein